MLDRDRDGIYDPGTANGRLLLGLKGQISELELHTIRSRLIAGLLNKADRGELALPLPVGLTRDERGVVLKDPDMEMRQRLELVFSTFLQVRSASKTAKALNDQEPSIPRRDRFGEVTWMRPTIGAVLLILRNPAYAGAFVYGRRQSVKKDLAHRPLQRPLPISDWKKRINDKYPAYVSWETYEKIQRMLEESVLALPEGARSPRRERVIESTVGNIRLKHGIHVSRNHPHRHRPPWHLPIAQLSQLIEAP
jgi:hypothetical protein